MADVNSVVLVGRLTKDAELKYSNNTNTAILRLSIAVNARRKQGDEWVDEASFFDVTMFGKLGESLSNYLTKGKQVGVQGQLRQERWEQDGQNRARVYILADNLMLIGGGNSNTNNSSGDAMQQSDNRNNAQPRSNPNNNMSSPTRNNNNRRPSGNAPIAPPADFEDDIPF